MIAAFSPLATGSHAGNTLLEVMVGVSIAAIGITGLCVANANSLSIARAHRELLIIDQCLQQRTEQCRTASWAQITDPAGISDLLSQSPVGTASLLQSRSEKITVSAYPPVTPPVAPIVVTRDATGTTTVVSQPPAGFYLRNALAVRIDLQETWASAQGRRTRVRETSTVVALGSLFPAIR